MGLILYAASTLGQVYTQLRKSGVEVAQLRQTHAQLESSIRELQSDTTDADFRQTAEKIAREKLGLVKPGETIYW